MTPAAEPIDTPIDPAVVRHAVAWMARLWSGDASPADQAACRQWRAAHPMHERAWSRLQVMESKLDGVPQRAAQQALLAPALAASTRSGAGRRRALQLLGLAALTGGAAYSVRESQAWQVASAAHRTATGEIREITLLDGTRVLLGTATALDVRFGPGERHLLLHTGEILVTTAPDPAVHHRPFRVETRHGTAEALGTRFTVRHGADTTAVNVFEGTVELRPRQAPAVAVRVPAGRGTRFSSSHVEGAVRVRASAAAWSNGMLVAENMRVADFVAEVGRYRSGLLRCDPAVADLRVTGVFPLRDTDRALINLTLGLPVEVTYRTRYWATVQPR